MDLDPPSSPLTTLVAYALRDLSLNDETMRIVAGVHYSVICKTDMQFGELFSDVDLVRLASYAMDLYRLPYDLEDIVIADYCREIKAALRAKLDDAMADDADDEEPI